MSGRLADNRSRTSDKHKLHQFLAKLRNIIRKHVNRKYFIEKEEALYFLNQLATFTGCTDETNQVILTIRRQLVCICEEIKEFEKFLSKQNLNGNTALSRSTSGRKIDPLSTQRDEISGLDNIQLTQDLNAVADLQNSSSRNVIKLKDCIEAPSIVDINESLLTNANFDTVTRSSRVFSDPYDSPVIKCKKKKKILNNDGRLNVNPRKKHKVTINTELSNQHNLSKDMECNTSSHLGFDVAICSNDIALGNEVEIIVSSENISSSILGSALTPKEPITYTDVIAQANEIEEMVSNFRGVLIDDLNAYSESKSKSHEKRDKSSELPYEPCDETKGAEETLHRVSELLKEEYNQSFDAKSESVKCARDVKEFQTAELPDWKQYICKYK